ncbi:MAG: Rieske (2Fe-2S) protein [Candidatus Competibacterales bacterium]|nr:Rieske (2Fe-2S) protein [Candidatus Competibacterales bacterium]
MGDWVRAADLSELQRRQRLLFRHQGCQIALFVTDDGLLACNNRCPHEGYPLLEGSLDGCLLTCHWHNWKFDLRSGANRFGGDHLRVYPIEIRDGAVWVDLTEPPLAQQRAEILARLGEACDDHDYSRIARELGRLERLGADPCEALRDAIRRSCERLEFGWTHAYAGSADWLVLYDMTDDPERRLVCLLESIGHIAWDVLRESLYPYPETARPHDEAALVAAIEAEDEAAAIARVRGALADGLHFPDLERALTRAALSHYSDFGHALIYVTKAGRLIERLGPTVERPLLLALVRSLVHVTREDQIPEFRGYHAALARWGKADDDAVPDPSAWRDLGIDAALEQTVQASRARPEALFDTLLAVNAERLLAFDSDWQYRTDRPVSDNVGWLDFTHALTFANAVRRQCRRFPQLWPAGLLQMACFAGRNRPYTLSGPELARWRVADAGAFFRERIEALFDHGQPEYIVSVHQLKTLLAVREAVAESPSASTREYLLAGLNRFLHSPLKRKHSLRTVRQARRFVAKNGPGG